ncbi:MAG: hypothetical protein R3D00_05880 [Bacteroidia bacterium]
MKYVLQIVAALVIMLAGKFFVPEELRPEFVGGGLILLITLLFVEIGHEVYTNWNRIPFLVRCWYLGMRGEYVRFSMSYQYRIKIQNRYLLVKNSNFGHYQLVGGKYKRNVFTNNILKTMGATDDSKLQTVGLMKDDLAVFVPAKNAIKFIDWFNTKKDREVSHWREFYEELIDVKGKVLPHDIFPYINYNYTCSVITPLKRTPGWECWEILQYDVLDLLPNSEQEAELEKLLAQGDTDYIKWADEELIKHLGHDNREKKKLYDIGQHTKWVIQEKWSKD